MATLLLLSINSIYTVGKPPAAQAIKPAHLIDTIHAPTRVLTYLARGTQSIDWRANSSIGMVLQGARPCKLTSASDEHALRLVRHLDELVERESARSGASHMHLQEHSFCDVP